MTDSLRTTILGEVAGTYAITEESAAAYDFVGNQANMVLCEPYEKRFLDSLWRRGKFRRFNSAGGFWVEDDHWRYPGLEPRVSRGQMYVPRRANFALGAI